MNELATLITTTIGLAVILLFCIFLLAFILVDIIKEINFNKSAKVGRNIFRYFKRKDKELD